MQMVMNIHTNHQNNKFGSKFLKSRDPVVYGGSIYPSVQNLLLACRNEGLGAALTTLLCHHEPKVKELLNIPDGVATAAHIAIGWPAKPFPKKLSRRPVSDYSYIESYGESMFPDNTSS